MLGDPFTRAYQAILRSLMGWPGFAQMVQAGNVIDMTVATVSQTLKPQAQDADTPEAALMQGAFELRPFGSNSRVIEMRQSYLLLVTSRNLNLVPVNGLKYQAVVALLKAGPTLGLDCVRTFDVTSASDNSAAKSQWSRDTRRWVTALSINVEMYLDRAVIAAQATTP